MKDLTTYVNESMNDSINESLLGMIIKLFTNKLKVLKNNETIELFKKYQDELIKVWLRPLVLSILFDFYNFFFNTKPLLLMQVHSFSSVV